MTHYLGVSPWLQ